MLTTWTEKEKQLLAHCILQHPGWTDQSLSEDIGSKNVVEVSLFLEELKKTVPHLVHPKDVSRDEIRKECNGDCEVPLNLTPEQEMEYLSFFNLPGLLRISHDVYLKDPNTSMQRSAVFSLYLSLRTWLTRIIRTSVALAVERRRQGIQLYGHRSLQKKGESALEITSKDVINALTLLEPGCLPESVNEELPEGQGCLDADHDAQQAIV
ncbi:uncharacterized protein SPPG_03862 [Spizellomyces punctatus DAOM BR117]|uniref:Uncharacterized protein n=1 Tax=Spizellomyces punctatus (strain DAOM BR117) TaxID=645134 RepID=A0A0L0HI20_SPIPD|nr:uncharacterized protein SPPG_03862 [Spizellomyces punctatus DAOM BR117]KND00747.1 hypothetical protein SPPG_03862 [Spizellomyces punctatus DAOM BR117]|eukprot:XP_016608786.1 hypothetical protein SPPG_03862 [Spizellomyces punctatus DAOM BR117]